MEDKCKDCIYNGLCELPASVKGVIDCDDFATVGQYPNKPAQRVLEALATWRGLKRCEPCEGCYLAQQCEQLEDIAEDFVLMKKRAVFAQENSGE